MSRDEASLERLDNEFDYILLDMKPYVLKHPEKTERRRCVVWIKKLCDPASCGSGLMGRKNRNLYARLLLHMLKRGVLEKPFADKPEPGSLPTLPTYMSIYLDEPLNVRPREHGTRDQSDWVTAELDGAEDSLTMEQLKDALSSTPVAAPHRRKRYEEKMPPRPLSTSPMKRTVRQEDRTVDGGLKADLSPYDSDLEARLNSWNLGGEMKIKMLEAAHQEEKVRIQQRHDADVEKILERKNCEIEETRSQWRAQQNEAEEMIRKLERKVQSVLRESQVISESKDKQISELKKMSNQSTDSLKNEWEKKLHATVTELEQEKFELHKKHTKNIQELLEETNLRLGKMESEYNARSQASEQTLRELELRVKQQSTEVEKGNALRQKAAQEKAQLEIQIASLSVELQEANRRFAMLQKEKQQQTEQHKKTIVDLQVAHEANMSHLHQEHVLSAAKASEVIGDFEKTVAHMKLQLQESEHRQHQQIRDQEIRFQQQRDELQISCDKQVLALHSEAENERTESKRKIAKLEDTVRYNRRSTTKKTSFD